jgi:RimJ/RimL family protein N-acetyltransferase
VHAERAGRIREGVKRQAYQRHGEWQDAVQFGLLREDLDSGE